MHLSPYLGSLRFLTSRAVVQPAKFLLWGGAPPAAAPPIARSLAWYEAHLERGAGGGGGRERDTGGGDDASGTFADDGAAADPAAGAVNHGAVNTGAPLLHGIDFDRLSQRRPDVAAALLAARDAFALRTSPAAAQSAGGGGAGAASGQASPQESQPEAEVPVAARSASILVGPEGLHIPSSGVTFLAGQTVQVQGPNLDASTLEQLLAAIGATEPATGAAASGQGGHALLATLSEATPSVGSEPAAAGAAAGSREVSSSEAPVDLVAGDRVSVSRLVPSSPTASFPAAAASDGSPREWRSFFGTVRHIASFVPFARGGPWVGVALDAPEGLHDGAVGGVRYFTCGFNHGLFVRASAVSRLPEPHWRLRDEAAAGAEAAWEAREQAKAAELDNLLRAAAAEAEANASAALVEKTYPAAAAVQRIVFGHAGATAGLGTSEETAPPVFWSDRFTALQRKPLGASALVAATPKSTPSSDSSTHSLLQRLLGNLGGVFRPTDAAGAALTGRAVGGAVGDTGGDPRLREGRPRLGDTVRVVAESDSRRGAKAEVMQDDHDAQPYMLRFSDTELGKYFYAESAVVLLRRGSRPTLGDAVVIQKPGDARHAQPAVVVQDDQDAQPYRLRYADGSLSLVFFRQEHVELPPDELQRRAGAEKEAGGAGSATLGRDAPALGSGGGARHSGSAGEPRAPPPAPAPDEPAQQAPAQQAPPVSTPLAPCEYTPAGNGDGGGDCDAEGCVATAAGGYGHAAWASVATPHEGACVPLAGFGGGLPPPVLGGLSSSVFAQLAAESASSCPALAV